MYAIAIEFNIHAGDGNNPAILHRHAAREVTRFLVGRNFKKQGTSIFLGDESIDAVQAVMAVNEMSKVLPWLKECVTDIQLLRIDEINDLTPAL